MKTEYDYFTTELGLQITRRQYVDGKEAFTQIVSSHATWTRMGYHWPPSEAEIEEAMARPDLVPVELVRLDK